MMVKRWSFEDLGQEHSSEKEEQQRPEIKISEGWKECWCGGSRVGKWGSRRRTGPRALMNTIVLV